MIRLRRLLGLFVIAWLGCQAATLAVVPAALWLNADAAPLECTCTHGDHAMCPMHHRATLRSTLCALQSTDSSDAESLTALLGQGAIVPIRITLPAHPPSDDVPAAPTIVPALNASAPEPPPPRL